MNAVSQSDWRQWPLLTSLCLVWLAHVVQCGLLFKNPSTAWERDAPILNVDHAIHFYHGQLGARFLTENGRTWGYDPFFMAGYPKSPLYDPSSKIAELWCFLGGSSARSYKIGLAATLAVVPVLLWLAGRALSIGRGAEFLVVLLSWAYWWTGFPNILVRSGLVGFLAAATVGLCVLSLTLRWAETPGWGSALLLLMAAPLACWVHPTTVVMWAPPCLIAYGLGMKGHGKRWHLVPWLVAVVCVAANLVWISAMLRWWPIKTTTGHFLTTSSVWAWLPEIFIFPTEPALVAVLWAFAAVGMGQWWRQRRVAGKVWLFTILYLAALTYAGSFVPLTRSLEPLRFRVPLNLALCVPAAAGMACILAAVFGSVRSAGFRQSSVGWACTACVIALLGLWGRADYARGNGGSIIRHCVQATLGLKPWFRPFVIGFQPEHQQLIEWIRQHTDRSARILLEDQLRLHEATDAESAHWTPLLPGRVRREFIGGLYNNATIQHAAAHFGDFHLGGRKITQWSAEELKGFCEQYNIGWILCWSPLSRRTFDQFADLAEPLGSIPRWTDRETENQYYAYRVQRIRASFLSRGQADLVEADYNQIILQNVVPEAGEVVLRYHWLPTLQTEPELELLPQPIPGDPVGFIKLRLDHPVPRLRIFNSYQWR